jgi:hypothetical protein
MAAGVWMTMTATYLPLTLIASIAALGGAVLNLTGHRIPVTEARRLAQDIASAATSLSTPRCRWSCAWPSWCSASCAEQSL